MNKDKQYWLALAERYFDAQTTDNEEHELRHFASVTDDPDFDELRAVLGFTAVSRRRTVVARRPRMLTPMRAAAALALVIGLSVFMARDIVPTPEPDCIAYVNGKRITDESQIFRLMDETMSDINLLGDDGDLIENQLEMMFNDI